ncbi:hypothetical protein OSB04_004650 [Centaurea solstitialis]|uniref:AB hydrolase-1 domain-containing protein n=1 Tax=Centaurea solstitialis TaxID=347529 RepID=A0AA38WP02_9ASTR|nr:hypothetical protein OSB04_004650 [Centaurea solstitialis]
MAFSLPSSPPLNLPTSYPSSTVTGHHTSAVAAVAGHTRRRLSLTRTFVTKASENDDETPSSFNPFGFVTDNPSSRSAIQLPEAPAEDGNVGQMLYRIEDKGGNMVLTSNLEALDGLSEKQVQKRSSDARLGPRGTVVFLHGAPTQSYSYRVVMSQLADSGFHCFAPDWIGFGFSDKPQPGYGYDYTGRKSTMNNWIIARQTGDQISFLASGSGISCRFLWINLGLKKPQQDIQTCNNEHSSDSFISNPRIVSTAKDSFLIYRNNEHELQLFMIPLLGEFTCQNAIMAERFIEAGSAYVLKVEKADVYRLPYLRSSGPGFALLEAAKRINFKATAGQIADGFKPERWDKPILVAWGMSDKYLPQSIAEEFQKGNPSAVTLKLIEGAGHMPQEDWPEKVIDALRYFL